MSIYNNFQEIRDNSDIDSPMPIAIASTLKDLFKIKFSKDHFNTCKVQLYFKFYRYEIPADTMDMDIDIYIMHKFGNSIKEFFKNIITNDMDLYLVNCQYFKSQPSIMDLDMSNVSFYFEYFKTIKKSI